MQSQASNSIEKKEKKRKKTETDIISLSLDFKLIYQIHGSKEMRFQFRCPLLRGA